MCYLVNSLLATTPLYVDEIYKLILSLKQEQTNINDSVCGPF